MRQFRRRKLLILETNLDDMNPQGFEPLMERLFAAGALDVVLIPAVMKKSRPAVVVQILAEPKRQEKLLEILFAESTTLGIRSYLVERFELNRKLKKIRTPYGDLTVKVGTDRRGRVLNIAPEYESCLAVSRRKKISLKKVYLAGLHNSIFLCMIRGKKI